MIKKCPDLEIRIDRESPSSYIVEYRLSLPGRDVDSGSSMQEPLRMMIDLGDLEQDNLDCYAYGLKLTQSLFVPKIRDAFIQALTVAKEKDESLRVRLFIGPTARELHDLRWETLRNPHDESPLSMSERILFSRYVRTEDIRAFGLPPKEELQALVVVANPTGLERYGLAPINVSAEIDRARTALGDIKCVELASMGKADKEAILDCLRRGCDICYLVCHGSFHNIEKPGGVTSKESYLWLEDKDCGIDRVSGEELVREINLLQECPRLVVLASCETGGSGRAVGQGDPGALAALGPQLSSAGVPAVVAMHGSISMDTIKVFMPILFRELNDHGTIDRAMAIARRAVQDNYDWWMPVLYSRLKSGRLWYAPGFGGNADEETEMWSTVLDQIEHKQCTPILGLGLCEGVLGSRHELAEQWARDYGFPMAPYERDDFPRVAQYLAVNRSEVFPRNNLYKEIRKKLDLQVSDEERKDLLSKSLEELFKSVGPKIRTAASGEVYRILADLSLPIYVTTDPTNLLAGALEEKGRFPVVDYSRWHAGLEQRASELREVTGYEPSDQKPLVFHLFGTIRVPESLVVTEDDYFDFLIGFTSNKDIVPKVVRHNLVNTGLLFLGFQLEEWNFRVLLRCLQSLGGEARRARYRHVSAQIDPNKIVDPEGARQYLEKYFQSSTANPNVNVFWGSLRHFMSGLQQHRREFVS